MEKKDLTLSNLVIKFNNLKKESEIISHFNNFYCYELELVNKDEIEIKEGEFEKNEIKNDYNKFYTIKSNK